VLCVFAVFEKSNIHKENMSTLVLFVIQSEVSGCGSPKAFTTSGRSTELILLGIVVKLEIVILLESCCHPPVTLTWVKTRLLAA
jgi:hypothetical protein